MYNRLRSRGVVIGLSTTLVLGALTACSEDGAKPVEHCLIFPIGDAITPQKAGNLILLNIFKIDKEHLSDDSFSGMKDVVSGNNEVLAAQTPKDPYRMIQPSDIIGMKLIFNNDKVPNEGGTLEAWTPHTLALNDAGDKRAISKPEFLPCNPKTT